LGAAVADKIEATGPDPAKMRNVDKLPPDLALRDLAIRQAAARRRLESEMQAAVERARAEGLSWHMIALPLQMTAEGARRKFSHQLTG